MNKTNNNDLLNKWLKRNDLPQKEQIEKRPKTSSAALSFGQQQLWVVHQLHPTSSAHQYSEIVSLSGKLDVANLQQALGKVVQKHEILRTTYELENNKPIQVIHNCSVLFEFVDFTSEQVNQQQAVQQQVLQLSRKTFDLAKDLPWRFTLFKLSDNRFDCLVSFHHILIDEWSVSIFWRDLAAAYMRKSLITPKIQYADFAHWQQRKVDFQQDIAYWKQQLHGLIPTELPLDFERPTHASFEGKQLIKPIPAKLLTQLKQLGKVEKTTLFTILASTFNLLLLQYTGRTDVSFGSPITLRNKKELEGLMGYFTNTLVWRTNLSGNPSFVELLKRTQKNSKEAMARINLPFAKIVNALHIKRTTNQNPLFNLMFIYKLITDKHEFNPPNITATAEVIDMQVSSFDITLFIREKDNKLDGLIEYNTQLFKATRIEQLLNDYIELLHRIVAQPSAPIQSLIAPIQTESQVLPTISWLHEEIEKQALQNPNQIAVSFNDQLLSYRQLNQRANLLAQLLIEGGVRPNTIVGIHLHRSIEMVVGILGILKAGGAYLPLDPNYPQERLHFMVEDSRLMHIVSDSRFPHLLPTKLKKRYLIDQLDWHKETSSLVLPQLQATDLAYIIYTSGSSGQPKGVKISHNNLRYSTDARLQYYAQPPKSYLLMSSFSFDSSVAGIFWTLATGGKLVVTPYRAEQDLRQLSYLIEKEQVTHILLLPSLYELLLQSSHAQQLASLNTIIVAGETCLPAVVKLHHSVLPTSQLYNEYGPTEATVWSTVYRITAHDQQQLISIGKPIAYTKIYILNEQLEEVSPGTVGEIFISGSCLSAGYLHAAEMTSNKFIYSSTIKERLYKTGDMGRYRADGCIDFLGRADQQVKIRGHRIELNEVATRLRAIPKVKEVAITLKSGMALHHDEELVRALQTLTPEKIEALLRISESSQETASFKNRKL